MDGFECCRQIRRTDDLPVLIVSARGDSHDVVAGLEAGADDYIRKPFDVAELAARLRALRRRVRPAASPAQSDGEESSWSPVTSCCVPTAGRSRSPDDEVHLTKTEFRLLFELASHPGRVF